MAVNTFDDVKVHRAENIRKALEMSIFVKPYDEADTAIASIYTAVGGLVIPTGYTDVGMTTKDNGATWSRDVTSEDVNSIGYAEPTRRDITGDVKGLQFVAQESKRQTFELYHGVDLSATVPDTDGGIFFDAPSRPAARYYRVLALAKDGSGADALYFARWLPRASVTDLAEQTWSEGTEVQYSTTLTGYLDSAVGTSMRELWGGPGFDAAVMGFGA